MAQAPVALSRTCDLTDFADCLSVARWQQCLAEEAWTRWQDAQHVRTRTPGLAVNWSGAPFVVPGPSGARVLFRGHSINGHGPGLPAIYGLSVLDHVDAPLRFLRQASRVLRPGGLLVLTFAFWNAEGPDCAAGCDDRLRIYDARSWTKLIAEARRIGFSTFGGHDWAYHGDLLEDHTLASLVLTWR